MNVIKGLLVTSSHSPCVSERTNSVYLSEPVVLCWHSRVISSTSSSVFNSARYHLIKPLWIRVSSNPNKREPALMKPSEQKLCVQWRAGGRLSSVRAAVFSYLRAVFDPVSAAWRGSVWPQGNSLAVRKAKRWNRLSRGCAVSTWRCPEPGWTCLWAACWRGVGLADLQSSLPA